MPFTFDPNVKYNNYEDPESFKNGGIDSDIMPFVVRLVKMGFITACAEGSCSATAGDHEGRPGGMRGHAHIGAGFFSNDPQLEKKKKAVEQACLEGPYKDKITFSGAGSVGWGDVLLNCIRFDIKNYKLSDEEVSALKSDGLVLSGGAIKITDQTRDLIYSKSGDYYRAFSDNEIVNMFDDFVTRVESNMNEIKKDIGANMKKNYKAIIATALTETVAQAVVRISKQTNLIVKRAALTGQNIVTVTYDHAANKTRAEAGGRSLFEHDGEDLWNDLIIELRRRKRRGELGENPRFILKTENIEEGRKVGEIEHDFTDEIAI